MTKKIFALVMVVSVLGSIFVAGCKKDDADTTATTGATAGTAGKDAPATTTGDTAGKTTG